MHTTTASLSLSPLPCVSIGTGLGGEYVHAVFSVAIGCAAGGRFKRGRSRDSTAVCSSRHVESNTDGIPGLPRATQLLLVVYVLIHTQAGFTREGALAPSIRITLR